MTILSVEPTPLFDEDTLRLTSSWIRELSLSWHTETPIRLHEDTVDASGAPEFDGRFLSFIERDCRVRGCRNPKCNHGMNRPNPRKRARNAMRKLKRAAPREFDALYLIIAHGFTFADAAAALTRRAVQLNKPERYSESDILILTVSAVDKVSRWY